MVHARETLQHGGTVELDYDCDFAYYTPITKEDQRKQMCIRMQLKEHTCSFCFCETCKGMLNHLSLH